MKNPKRTFILIAIFITTTLFFNNCSPSLLNILISSNKSKAATSVSDANKLRILFTGNSLIGYQNLPYLLERFVQESGLPTPYITEYTRFGTTLEQRFKNKRYEATQPWHLQAALTNYSWDVVVLQELSHLPLTAPDKFKRSVRKFVSLIRTKSPKARILLFQNWNSPQRKGLSFKPIKEVYAEMAQELDLEVVPVGEAWDIVSNADNKKRIIDLYRKKASGQDDHHPNRMGGYLNALMVFRAIYNQNVTGLSAIGVQYIRQQPIVNGSGIYRPKPNNIIDLVKRKKASEEQIRYLQKIANSVNPKKS